MKIIGPRINLRYFEDFDLKDFHEYRSDPVVCRYQGYDPHSEEQAKTFLDDNKDKKMGIVGDWIQLAVEQNELKKVIGDIGVKLRLAEPQIADLGYTINRNFQQQGYATEAMHLMLNELFSNHNVRKINLRIEPRNIASVRLAEKMGFQLDGVLREEYFDEIDQAWFDEHIYSLLKREYR